MTPMNLPECDHARLEALLLGRLAVEEEQEVERHLDSCEGCRLALEARAAGGEWWADLRQIGARGDTWPADPVTATEPGKVPPGWLEPSDAPGSIGRLGPYEVARVLGRGGMGVVFQAFDPDLHRPVAIKIIAPELAGSAAARRRFAREARAAAAVAHDHVVAIHAVAETSAGLPYLVMAFVAGKSLQERIDSDGPLEVAEILRIGMQTAAGLAGAHAQGLVHRDIKPANILLENGVERVKITDFGLARIADDASLSQTGVVAGTPEYMSPEQARGEAVDSRSDLFSLGSVLYTMATGHPPFRAPNALAILRRIADDAPRPVRSVNAEIPTWLEAIIARLLAKDPGDRFHSADEVADLLGRCLAYHQQPDRRGKLPFEVAPVAPRRRRRRVPRLVALGLMLGVGLVGLGLAEAAGVDPVAALVATIIRVTTPEGTLVIEVEDPAVKVALDGKDLVITGGGPQEVRIQVGEHHLSATRGGTPVHDQVVTITRDNKPSVVVRREVSPALVIAPPATPNPPSEPARRVVATRDGVMKSDPTPALPAIDPKDGTVITYPRWYRPGPARQAAGETSATVVAGPVVPGLDQTEALRPVPLDDPTPVPLWPGSSVTYQAYSPDGTTLAVTSNLDFKREINREILLFDPKTRRQQAILTGHQARVWTMVFSPDGRKLAAATGDWGYPAESGKVYLWDLAKPVAPQVIAAKIPLAFAVAFAPDGQTLAYGGWDDTVSLFDLTAGKVRATGRGHTDNVRFLAYSPDGKILASASWDKTVRFWDPATGEPDGPPIGPVLHAVNSLSFSPDGKLLAGALHGTKPTEDKAQLDRVLVWAVASRAVRAELVAHSRIVFFAAFSPDGKTLASSGGLKDVFGEVKLWDTTTWTERRTLGGFRSWIGCVAFAPDGQSMIAASDHGGQKSEVRVYDLSPSFEATPEPYRPDGTPTWAVAFSPDGKTLAVGTGPLSRHGRVWLRDRQTGKSESPFTTILGVRALVYSPGDRLAAGSFDGTIAIRDESLNQVRKFPGHDEAINALAFSPDGTTLASAARDGMVKLWADQGKLIRVLAGGEAWSLAFTPDGKLLAAGMKDGSIRFNDPTTGIERSRLNGHTLGVSALGFSPDGRTLASASWDRTVKLWDAFANGEPTTLTGHDQPIRALAFSPDGRTLATADGAPDGSTDPGVVHLWDIPGGSPRATLRNAQARLWSVAFSPDGQILAAASDDGNVTFWTKGPATSR